MEDKDKLDELISKYKISLPEKIKLIDTLFFNFKKTPNDSSYNSLRFEVHKLAGSAGMYGFNEISLLCKDFQLALDNLKKKLDDKQEINEELRFIEKYMEKLKSSISLIEKKEISKVEEVPSFFLEQKEDFDINLYIADFDLKFLELLQNDGKNQNLKIQIDTSPEEVNKKLNDENFKAGIILIGHLIPKNPELELKSLDIINIIKKYKQKHPNSIIGLILPKADLNTRLKAINEGIEYILEKPLTSDLILNIVKSTIPTYLEHPFKVLVLDDDKDICEFISSSLMQLNITVKAITDANNFDEEIKNFDPDLLLLDIMLEGYDGIEILYALRSNIRFKNLPVAIITALGNEEIIKKAYKERIDDFIIKPISKDILKAKIINLARLHSFQKVQQIYDQNTGLYTHRYFLFFLNKSFEKIKNQSNLSHSLALLSIENYEELIKEKKSYDITNIILELSLSIRIFFKAFDLIGIFDKGIFSVFLENLNGIEAKKLLNDFFNKLTITIKLHEKEQKIKMVSSISIFPQDGKTSNELIAKAKEYLTEALKKGNEAIICPSADINYKISVKEIFLLDDDADILSYLRFFFEKKGFKVTTHATINQAYEDLSNRESTTLPNLIIFDRLLSDGDGLDLYKKLKNKFINLPPIIFLSKLTTEKDILETLQTGAIDYVTKPFNINILLEKSLKLLEVFSK